MVAFWGRKDKAQNKPRLLAIDDCLMDAADPAAADECLVAPAASQELVEETSFDAFLPLLATGVALLIGISMMPVSPDQAVGELGTPQIVANKLYGSDFVVKDGPGPPAF
jgi:hypothetical protein